LYMITMFADMIPDRVLLCDKLYDFMHPHEQKHPIVSNLFRRGSYLCGRWSSGPSKSWQHHQHHIKDMWSLSFKWAFWA
jgi:hypothetical protein